jgi:hypothetical protein
MNISTSRIARRTGLIASRRTEKIQGSRAHALNGIGVLLELSDCVVPVHGGTLIL